MRFKGLLAAIAVASTGSAAFASTEEAWQEFRARTEAACRALLPEGSEAEISVDPFGSESYGIALVHMGRGTTTEVTVCVLDKQAGTAELSGAFAPVLRLEPAAAE